MAALTGEERDRAREVLRQLGGRPRLAGVGDVVLDVPLPVADALTEVLEAAADGERAVVLRSPSELTTEQAAAVLGVSRPTVTRLVDAGKLPARMVGTHRRLALAVVLAYREESGRRRRAALDEMTRHAEGLGLYD